MPLCVSKHVVLKQLSKQKNKRGGELKVQVYHLKWYINILCCKVLEANPLSALVQCQCYLSPSLWTSSGFGLASLSGISSWNKTIIITINVFCWPAPPRHFVPPDTTVDVKHLLYVYRKGTFGSKIPHKGSNETWHFAAFQFTSEWDKKLSSNPIRLLSEILSYRLSFLLLKFKVASV